MSRRNRRAAGAGEHKPRSPAGTAAGATWSPLSSAEVEQIAAASVRILTEIGMSEAPPELCDTIIAAGGRMAGERLLYPPDLIEQAIRQGPRTVLLAGQTPDHDLDVGGRRVYAGTGGAAPNVLDPDTGNFRPSVLNDLFRAARLADALEHVQFFSRSLVAGDIEDPLDFDLATAAASLLGTSKHVMVQATDPAHVAGMARLCHEIAGGETAFRTRPFLSLNINHAVPPLRFHRESMQVMVEAVRHGIPVHCNVFGQLGASSPVHDGRIRGADPGRDAGRAGLCSRAGSRCSPHRGPAPDDHRPADRWHGRWRR